MALFNNREVPLWNKIVGVIAVIGFIIFVIFQIVNGKRIMEAMDEYQHNTSIILNGYVSEMKFMERGVYLIGIEPTEFVYQSVIPPQKGIFYGIYSHDKKKVYIAVSLNDETIEKLPDRDKVKIENDKDRPFIHVDSGKVIINNEVVGELDLLSAGWRRYFPKRIEGHPVVKF